MQRLTLQNKFNLDLSNLWEMSFVSTTHPAQSQGKCTAFDVLDTLKIDEAQNQITCAWQVTYPARFTMTMVIDQQSDQWQLHITITNHSDDLTVHDFKLMGMTLPCADAALLFPEGAGRRVADFSQMADIAVSYPSYRCSMPWLMLDDLQGGVYVGVHDSQDQCVDFTVNADEQAQNLHVSLTCFPFVSPGKTVTLPPVVIKHYDGHWSNAARFYRNWFDRVGKVASIPTWMRENSGWLLAILKQQNESVNYDYITGIDELADIAIARGLSTLGLFGWTVGGHDHLYPDYDPCPELGGRDALKAAIKRAKDRGLRVILYANGVIMDVATPFYRKHGKDAANIMADGRVNLSQINKFTDGTPVIYATACPSSPQWRKQMLSLAVQAHELGADGLLYDQIGVYGRHECHHPEHKHANPMDGYSTGRVQMIRQIAQHMQTIDQDFIIATESFIAPMARELRMIHGFGYGYGLSHYSSGNELYPDLLRMTFPEVVSTNRIPQPLMDRNVAHYAVMHGLRQELEIRYQDDVKLMRGEQPDWDEAYTNAAGSPPKKQMLLEAVAADEKNEMAKLMAFVKRHADVFYHGTYQSDLGFTLHSDAVQARAYRTADEQFAVVLMNAQKQVGQFELHVDDHQCTLVDTPNGSLAGKVQSLEPLSICLMKFTKKP
jgi:hypothetical protein